MKVIWGKFGTGVDLILCVIICLLYTSDAADE